MWCSNSLCLLAALAWQLAAAPLQFRTHDLPRAVFGAAYHAVVATQVDGRCPTGDVVLELAGGRLPRGIELSGEALAGVPKEFGVFPIRLRAGNSCAHAASAVRLNAVVAVPHVKLRLVIMSGSCSRLETSKPAEPSRYRMSS